MTGISLLVLLIFTVSLFSLQVVADDTPYFASLKKDKVNLRKGPGEKFPISWVYQERGYPVEVIDQYDIWYQIREADGTIGWVHRNMIGKSRTALVQAEERLMDKPSLAGKIIAVVQQGTIGKINRCPKDSDFCLISFPYEDKTIKGWILRQNLWGLSQQEEIG